MTAFDLWFEFDESTVSDLDNPPVKRATPEREPDGWGGSVGPAIGSAQWPRGPLTGLPMLHVLTLRLPSEWVEHNQDMPGFALFQGEGQFAAPRQADPDDPFEKQLLESVEHPRMTLLEDCIGGRFALLRLTDAELTGETAVPTDVRRPGEHPPVDEGPNAWEKTVPRQRVWLMDRPDPNAGLAPVDSGSGIDGRYEQPLAEPEEGKPWTVELKPWADELFVRPHLGGTSFPVQEVPDDLGPWYLELPQLPGMNIGGDGVLQLDLVSETLDWSCG